MRLYFPSWNTCLSPVPYRNSSVQIHKSAYKLELLSLPSLLFSTLWVSPEVCAPCAASKATPHSAVRLLVRHTSDLKASLNVITAFLHSSQKPWRFTAFLQALIKIFFSFHWSKFFNSSGTETEYLEGILTHLVASTDHKETWTIID